MRLRAWGTDRSASLALLQGRESLVVDGAVRPVAALAPGDTFELGGTRYVVEDERTDALRALWIRFIGAGRDATVDEALHATIVASRLRAALVLEGEGSLAGLARRLALAIDLEVAPPGPITVRVVVPPLRDRTDLDALLASYAIDAAAAFGAPDPALRPHDLSWVLAGGIATHAEAEEVIRRVVAARAFGITAGAERLGITHAALSRYLRRRKIPT